MKKRRILIITISLVCIGIVLAIVFAGRTTPEDTPDTAMVRRGDIMTTVPVRGNLEMPDKAHLSFGVTGTVKEVLVATGDSVEKGQVLATLDAPALKLSVETAELQVKIVEAQVKAALAQYEIALINLKEPPPAQNEKVLREQVNLAKASWETARLNLRIAKLSLESAKLNLEETEIVASFNATVADVTITEGKKMSAATLAAPAITLVGTSAIEMRGFIDELDIALVEVGQEAKIRLDALPGREVKGEVASISLIGTIQVGMVVYETTITLDDPYAELRDGMSATADIIIERRDNVLLIPNGAIRGTQEDPMVEVYIDDQVEERQITLGLSDGINTEVLSGLEEGEKVVLPARRR